MIFLVTLSFEFSLSHICLSVLVPCQHDLFRDFVSTCMECPVVSFVDTPVIKDSVSLLHAIFRRIGGNTKVLKKILLGNLCAVFRSVGSLFVELN